MMSICFYQESAAKRSKGSNQALPDQASVLGLREQAMGLREAGIEQREATLAQSEASNAMREATLAQSEASNAQRRATLSQREAIVAQRENAVLAKEASIGGEALLLEISELKRQLASERARSAANAQQREAILAKTTAKLAQSEAIIIATSQREAALVSREASSGRREQALLLEIAELERQLVYEKAFSATAVEMHRGIKAAVQVKKEKVEELEDAGRCKVCYERPANVVCFPCGHCSTCKACADDLPRNGDLSNRKCPICRDDITSTNIFIMS